MFVLGWPIHFSTQKRDFDDFFRQSAFTSVSIVCLTSQLQIFGCLLQVQAVQPSRAQQSVITQFYRPHQFALSPSLHNSSVQLSRSESHGRSAVVVVIVVVAAL